MELPTDPNLPLQNREVTMMVLRAIDQGPAVWATSRQGLRVFTVRNGVVARFRADALLPTGTVELYPALPERPADGQFPTTAKEAMALMARARRLLAAGAVLARPAVAKGDPVLRERGQ